MKIKPLPSLDFLSECFDLSDSSPSGLVWKVRPRSHFNTDVGMVSTNSKFANTPAGHVWTRPDGLVSYWQVKVKQQVYYVHRIVYSLRVGCVLDIDTRIDHNDGDGLNNKKLNLRKADCFENNYNARLKTNNTSGYKGVSWHTVAKSWRVRVRFKGKCFTINGCPTPEKANELARELREKLHKEFTNHG